MTFKIGVTGGIGSGKSTICEVFRQLKVPVFEADIVSKKIINTNNNIIKQLVNLYGYDIYTSNGTINRKKLASIIFNDDIQLQKVNNIIHPEVRKEFKSWVQRQNSLYVIHEAAILFETGFYKSMDFTILVTAPEEDRIKRLIKRDNTDSFSIRQRMEKQWTDEKKIKLATLEIKNNNKDLIIPRILQIDNQLKKNGKIW